MTAKNLNYAIIFVIIITTLILLKLLATKTIFYGVFYFFLTLFFIYIFVKEKDIAKKSDIHREKFVNKIAKKYNIEGEKKVKRINKTFYYIETIGTALILVVIIQRFYIGNFKIPIRVSSNTDSPITFKIENYLVGTNNKNDLYQEL